MRHRSSAAGLVAGVLILTLAGPAAATTHVRSRQTASARSVHLTTNVRLPIDAAECRAAPGSVAAPARRPLADCLADVTFELTASRAAPLRERTSPASRQLRPTASACTITWTITSLRATVQSVLWGLLWSASANATGYGDSCGRVLWTSVTCDQHGIGYAVRIDWCGAYPGRWAWNTYTSSNIGLNITVSAVANGTPISWTHGARNGFNPYAGTQYGFFAW